MTKTFCHSVCQSRTVTQAGPGQAGRYRCGRRRTWPRCRSKPRRCTASFRPYIRMGTFGVRSGELQLSETDSDRVWKTCGPQQPDEADQTLQTAQQTPQETAGFIQREGRFDYRQTRSKDYEEIDQTPARPGDRAGEESTSSGRTRLRQQVRVRSATKSMTALLAAG